MATLDVAGTVDSAGRLVVDTPLPVRPGRVRVHIDLPEAASADDDEEELFRALVTRSWADSLNDPREDVYTLADGVPIDPDTVEATHDAR